MKKIHLLFIVLFGAISLSLQAQAPYSVGYYEANYNALNNGLILNNTPYWDDEIYEMPIGFSFEFDGQTYSSVFVDTNGALLFQNPEIVGSYLGAFASIADLAGLSDGSSTIRYFLDGQPGNRILIIDWQNAGFYDDTEGFFLNFQIWLYEGTNQIAFHFGENNLTDSAFDLFFQDFSGTYITGVSYDTEAYILTGNIVDPFFVYVNTEASDIFSDFGYVPYAGTVYLFTPATDNCFTNLNVDVLPCNENGTFSVAINFDYDETMIGDLFSVHGNGVNYGNFAYGNLPITIENLAGNGNINYEFGINDLQNNDCHIATSIGAIDCAGNTTDCLTNLNVETLPCNGDGTFSVMINFDYDETMVGDLFSVHGNGVNYGNFAYGNLPITLENLVGDGNVIYEFGVTDLQNSDCHISMDLGAVFCPIDCEITNIAVTTQACEDDGTFSVILNFSHNNTGSSGQFRVTNGINMQYGVYNYSDLPITIANLLGDGETEHGFEIIDMDLSACYNYISISPVNCEEGACQIYNVSAEVSDCDDAGMFFVNINAEYNNEGGSFSIVGNGANYGSFSYADLPIEIGPLAGNGTTNYEFDIFDNENIAPPCTNYVHVGQVSCAVGIENISATFSAQVVAQSQDVRVYLTSANVMEVQMDCFDIYGRKIYTTPQKVSAGTNEYNFSLGDVPQGIYFMHITEIENSENKVVRSFLRN
ncbi:MAG: hypothetical protein R2798_03410 [Chitinophagales bacterium]